MPVPVFALVLPAASFQATPAPPASASPTIRQVIDKENQFTFADGSSYYTFKKDGTFYSGPLGISGRVIVGYWTSSDGVLFTVDGIWSDRRDTPPFNDYRRMTFSLRNATLDNAPKQFRLKDTARIGTLYQCYFTVEEMVRQPLPAVNRADAEKQIREYYRQLNDFLQATDIAKIADLARRRFAINWVQGKRSFRDPVSDPPSDIAVWLDRLRETVVSTNTWRDSIEVTDIHWSGDTATVESVWKSTTTFTDSAGDFGPKGSIAADVVQHHQTDTWALAPDHWRLSHSLLS